MADESYWYIFLSFQGSNLKKRLLSVKNSPYQSWYDVADKLKWKSVSGFQSEVILDLSLFFLVFE